MVDAALTAPEEDEVPECERRIRHHLGRRVVLVLSYPGER